LTKARSISFLRIRKSLPSFPWRLSPGPCANLTGMSLGR
jgi:hypothetical protein